MGWDMKTTLHTLKQTAQKHQKLLVGLAAGVAIGSFSVAGSYAAIPNNGSIHACYANTGGSLRVIDSSDTCDSGETALNWNQSAAPAAQTGRMLSNLSNSEITFASLPYRDF